MPTKYKIFQGKGALNPYNPRQGTSPWTYANTSLTDCPSFNSKWNDTHAICISVRKGGGGVAPILMKVGGKEPLGGFKIGGSMESLVEMVQIEDSLRNYVNSTLWNVFSWVFKTPKPMNFRGLRSLDPWCHDGISDGNSANWQFSAKLHVNFTPDLTL